MQDQNNKSSTNLNQPAAGASSSATSASTNATNASTSANTSADAKISRAAQNDFVRKIVDKINSSENILITLSRDPSVDELAAAIGLTLYLDGIQKHATAIYSGRTPDALKFLQPDATFERTTDGLQDFIIALNKEKADHLRYKLEGDFVKVFITPYKKPITKDDLSFSYGDYNVNFVIAINVSSASQLDEALREHGRIMHDASAVNITTGVPGRFGEIEWSNPASSALCEMVADLIFALQGSDDPTLDPDIATALLTGIVAATDRFSNDHTNSDTLSLASKLMSMGANQQLITSNIHGNEVIHNDDNIPSAAPAQQPKDSTNLEVDHEPTPVTGNPAATSAPSADSSADPAPTSPINSTNSVAPDDVTVQPVIPQPTPSAPVDQMQIPNLAPSAPNPASAPVEEMHLPGVTPPSAAPTAPNLQPPEPQPAPQTKNYAEMMEAALADAATPDAPTAPQTIATPPPVVETPNYAPTSAMPSATPAEPVATPDAPILPPPPAPTTGPDMMPPVLPPVQTPPENF